MYFGIPPEINAFRLTRIGAGSAAHVAQAAAYETVGIAHVYQSVESILTAATTAPAFQGSGGIAMITTAAPQAAWIATAGGHAQAAAKTIEAGTAAYTTAAAATIPFEEVVENRIREVMLELTNFFGFNTAAIAANNGQYAEYWAQNASAMMGYLAAITALVAELAIPLIPNPTMANPAAAAAGVAGLAGDAVPLGVQMLSTGVGVVEGVGSVGASVGEAAMGAGTSALGMTGSGAASDTTQTLGMVPGVLGQAGTAGQVGATSPVNVGLTSAMPSTLAGTTSSQEAAPAAGAKAAGAAGEGGSPLLQSMSSLMGSVTSAPTQALGALGTPLSSVMQVPSEIGGQIGGLMNPLAALGGGMGGAPGAALAPALSSAPSGAAPALSAAKAGLSGLSSVNGGFAGGGSVVTAALTKPSAGSMGAAVGLPGGWWSTPDTGASAGARAAGNGGAMPMGGGMYGPMAGAGSAQRDSEHADAAEADKTITVADRSRCRPLR